MMRIKLFLFICFVHLSAFLFSQKEGDKWVIGYYSLGSQNYSIMYLDFSKSQVEIEWHFNNNSRIYGTAANICDPNGDVILYTNGMGLFGKYGEAIADTIAYDGDPFTGYWIYFYTNTYGQTGFPKHNGALILPIPGHEHEYSVIYHSAELHPDFYFQVSSYLEAKVRMNPDSTFELLYKDSLIGYHHQWYTSPIIASRHANGRDWWIIAFDEDSPRYFSFLLDPAGVRLDHEGYVDIMVKDGLGQAAFSSQGNYIARMDATTFDEGQFITLYSFDRCNGDLERLETFHTEAGTFTGVAFSPTERYLYADDNYHLWQWDLWAEDIAASQTLVDTFDGFIQPGWVVMRFGPMVEAPDGRIYVIPPAGSSEFIHVIDRPDLPASECRFLQHHIDLTRPNKRTAPNIPNFRLGPLDGSPCDTLGLDNYPVARWRYEEDIPGYRYDIRMTDLSFYDPEVWHWDFGDGSTSDQQSPVHTFEAGLYHVCLTVSNSYGSDSTCQWIEILSTSLDEVVYDAPDLSIDPNPFSEALIIRSRSGTIRPVHLQLYDIHGRLVFDQPTAPVPVKIFLPEHITPGMYFCRIHERHGEEYSFKLVKQ